MVEHNEDSLGRPPADWALFGNWGKTGAVHCNYVIHFREIAHKSLAD